jgi:hypothetical protein
MTSIPSPRVRSWSLIATLVCAGGLLGARGPNAAAEPVPVRHVEGTVHGFLELRSEEGRALASGDFVQIAHGDQVTLHTLFNFKDGSIDDETTVFSQRRNFQLITDRHVQKGPSFPHPIDMLIDRRNGQVTVRSFGKDGKEEVKTDHLQLPPDLANGIVSLILENIRPHTPETTLPILVATPKPRIVKLVVSSRGEEPFSVAGSSHQAIHYEIKIELGGVPGVVAPLIGKQPPNIQIWVVGGQAPTFVREQGPIYPDGPMMTIELASPVWQNSPKSGD